MTVIAMTREMGSLGKEVALGLAEKLDLQIVHHELIEHELAEKLHIKDSSVHRFLEGNASLLERWKIDKHRLSRYTAEEVLELAARGNVIIRGWGATYLLRPISHVLRVRICAPIAFRVKVLMERLGIDDESLARKEIERSDAAHSRTVTQLFGINWEEPLLYDVVLNTERIPIDHCVDLLHDLVQQPEYRETNASRAVLADQIFEVRVASAITNRFGRPARGLIVDVAVDAATGKVTLQGVADSTGLIRETAALVAAIDGVKEVDNRLTAMRLHSVE